MKPIPFIYIVESFFWYFIIFIRLLVLDNH